MSVTVTLWGLVDDFIYFTFLKCYAIKLPYLADPMSLQPDLNKTGFVFSGLKRSWKKTRHLFYICCRHIPEKPDNRAMALGGS